MKGFQIEQELYFLLLIIAILCIGLYFYLKRSFNKRIANAGDSSVVQKQFKGFDHRKLLLRYTLLGIVFLLISLALANPQLGDYETRSGRDGFDMIIALDVSSSMEAQDVSPSRLQRAKEIAQDLVESSRNTRFGLIVFAGDAYLQTPMTDNRSAVQSFIRSSNTGSVPVDGTNFKACIEQAITVLENSESTSAGLIIISDGENHTESANQTVKAALEKGIKIFTIGIGTTEGAPIPLYRNARINGYKIDKAGKTVISSFKPQELQSLAKNGSGRFYYGNNALKGKNLFNDVKSQISSQNRRSTYTGFTSYFEIPLFIAILLLICELMLTNRRGFQISLNSLKHEN